LRWEHTHQFPGFPADATGQDGPQSYLEDRIVYRLPLAARVAAGAIRRSLERMFAFRHERTRSDLMRHQQTSAGRRLRIAISGASGVVGKQLVPYLTTAGHVVLPLVRRPAREGEISWDPAQGTIEAGKLEGCDAVIHLAGENLSVGRWSPARKTIILESRRQGTRLISETIAKLGKPPRVLISASAVGYYGDRRGGPVDEDSEPGQGFLADVCRAWEESTQPAVEAGIRVVTLRIGVVLTTSGGVLARLSLPFKLGMGGPIGSGNHGFPWIDLDDLLAVIEHALFDEQMAGPVNAVAPQRVTQREFARTLGRVMHRPSFMPLPAFMVRLIFGEMGQSVLLEGALVEPKRLNERSFVFEHPELEEALRWELGRGRNGDVLPKPRGHGDPE
jgi:uncharacterized protein (TIGR01777 family)